MQWKTICYKVLKQNGIVLLAVAVIAWAVARQVGAAADSPVNSGSSTSGSSSGGTSSAGAKAPAGTPSTQASGDGAASSRRSLGYPGTTAHVQGTAKNSPATDGAFAEGESNSGEAPASDAEEVASPFATTFNDPPPRPVVTVEPASFNGVQPGVTTAQELMDKWGKGEEVSHDDHQTVLHFARPSYPQVEVTMVDDLVRSIVIDLDQPIPADTLARELHLGEVRPVNVPDDSGELLGQAYPERGVLFSITPDGKRVSHVVLDKIDLSAFVLRAEIELQTHTRSSLADIDYVLSRQSKNARALWLRARLMCTMARYDEALDDVNSALEIEPKQQLYHLTHAEILGLQGHYNDAAQDTKNVLAVADLPGEIKAKALCQLGDLLSACPAHDYKQAMEQHLAAIKTADQLSIDKRLPVRRAAKLVLVDAHLGMANDIACGVWQQKEKVVSKWLDRAHAYVEDIIAHEDGDPALRLHLAHGALTACAGAEGKVDSVPWARMALQIGKPLVSVAADPWTKLDLQWELGVALSDGLVVDELRGTVQHALTNTALTITYLETGAKGRRETPTDIFRLGWLYYRLGSLHATQHNDHKTAVAWYEKAFPLLDRPIPPTVRNQQGHYGEWLVSMGISYWEIGNQNFALQLTNAGAQHVLEAVDGKIMDQNALAIPYGNLAFMHDALGHKSEALSYARLAAKFEGTQTAKH